MRHFAGLTAFLAVALVVAPADVSVSLQALLVQEPPVSVEAPPRTALSAQDHAEARYHADLAAVRDFRPAYPFWQHIFQIPDGSIIFGSAEDGRLLATFPTRGNWARDGVWTDPALRRALDGVRLTRRLRDRRDQVEEALAPLVGDVVHNPTRGRFLEPHAARYGSFLDEWGAIYERFAVPPQIGLAQAIVESGLNGRARSGANARGFCQWLRRNWSHLNRLAPNVIEEYNQTTQAPYCAAHLTILATMYGSFIPALSEHHAGGVNVGRTVINGERLGGGDTREQYLMGAEFARDLRGISIRRYRDLFRTYGPRSFLYAEMVFGNTINVERLLESTSQDQIFAMRAPRDIPLTEVTAKTGLSRDEIKRFNPALIRRVPARANLYLPSYVEAFGPDVSFWQRPPSDAYTAVLSEFVQLDASVERWHEASFEQTLRGFQHRFLDTETEEGAVMGTMLAYIIGNLRTSRRAAILDEFRTSGRIQQLFERGLSELAR
ncbi:MAG: hypothetical protein CL483_06210 [Acidobacteria bacterium]|nr:hypothetical protein [Acidobacteriota bacterium]